jgi:hypothetical protein
MLAELARPRQWPVMNVAAVFVIVVAFAPLVLARLSEGASESGLR